MCGGDRMVVTERENEVLLFEQHEHARVCGELAEAWREDFFQGIEWRDSVIYAIHEHDNGWIELDKSPLLNETNNLPFSFIDYPLAPKLKAYKSCIDRVVKKDLYAGLLCSLQYSSFFEKYSNGRGEDFLSYEQKRQKQLKQKLSLDNSQEETLAFHFQLLQFCDHLSLYLCMNEPGVNKENEMIWFRKGFSQRFQFNQRERMIAQWIDQKTVALHSFPFKQEITVKLPYKIISKRDMDDLQRAYAKQTTEYRIVTIVGRT